MKLTLNKIELPALRDFVHLAFEDDTDLLTTYHISPGTLDHCVDHTMNLINTNADFYKKDMEIYVVHYSEIPIGYTVIIKNETAPNELYSFGINIDFRHRVILVEWLQKIKEVLGTPFGMVLWSVNTRAIDFFRKNGFTVHRTSKYLDNETQTLITCKE